MGLLYIQKNNCCLWKETLLVCSKRSIWEPSEKHLGSILEASGRHLEASGRHLGCLGSQGAPKVVWGAWGSKKCYTFLLKSRCSSTAIKWHIVFEGNTHFVLICTANLGSHSAARQAVQATGPLTKSARAPTAGSCLGKYLLKSVLKICTYYCLKVGHQVGWRYWYRASIGHQ